MTPKQKQALFTKIARDKMKIETLEERHSDSLDFPEVSVHEVRKGLEAAYEIGFAHGYKSARPQASPQALAAIVSYLQPATTNNAKVNAEIQRFAEQLAQMIGGWQEQGKLAQEVGL